MTNTHNTNLVLAATRLCSADLKEVIVKGVDPVEALLPESAEVLRDTLHSIHGPSIDGDLLLIAGNVLTTAEAILNR